MTTSNSATHFTPGPWRVDPDDRPGMEWNNHIVSVERPHLTICFMSHNGNEANQQGKANARLIAAAPDLLASLRAMVNRYCDDESLDSPIDEQARAAIAKAQS